MAEEPNGVVITLREIYDEVRATRTELQALNDAFKPVRETVAELSVWRRVVDRWRYGIPLATLIAVGSTIAAIYPNK